MARKMTRSEAGRLGGLARARQPGFVDHNRRIAPLGGRALVEQRGSEYMAKIGMRGAIATINAHGYDHFLGVARDYHLGHPSNLEVEMAAILDDLGLAYEREYVVQPPTGWALLVDFYLPDHNLAIEVNGRVHDPDLGFKDPGKERVRGGRIREAGYRLLVISHWEMARAAEMILVKIGQKMPERK